MRLTFPSSNKPIDGWLWGGLIASLLLILLAMTVPYINSQRAFLGGDVNDGFYQFTLQAASAFQRSPLEALQLISQSLTQDYNRLFSLPLIPFILLFGTSYLVYVISLAIVYLLPFCLTLGAIATILIPVYPKAVFASTTLIAALFTPNWITLLQGYPDVSAALMIVLGIWVVLQGVGQQFTGLLPYRWQVPLLGFLFGIGILLRRHFAYAVVAVLGAMLIHTAIDFGLAVRHYPHQAWRNLITFAIRLGLVITTTAITLLAFAWDFTIRAFTENYVSLYDSWSRPIGDVFQFYGELYGWLVWLLVAIGFLAGIVTRTLVFPAAVFINSFGFISILIWLFRLRYNETYYALHFSPFILLGLAAFVWTILLHLRGQNRFILLALFSMVLSWNAVVSITPVSNTSNPLRPLFAAAYPPPNRQNYGNVLQVMEYLRQVAPNGEPIFVVYNEHLPMHLILAAERTMHGEAGRILQLKQGSPTDSDGFHPIAELLDANYVVVTEPFLGWNESEQQAIQAVHTAFTEGWEITEDFAPLPRSFDLQNGVTATIYQRIRPTTPDRAVRLFHALQTQVNKPLGLQPDWISLSPNSGVQPVKRRRYSLTSQPAENAAMPTLSTFLYVGEFTEQTALKGRVIVPSTCAETSLTFSGVDEQGQAVTDTEQLQFTENTPLRLELNLTNAAYLMVEMANAAWNSAEPQQCSTGVNNLVVSSQ